MTTPDLELLDASAKQACEAEATVAPTSQYALLSRYGSLWAPKKLPRHLPRMTPGICFQNAFWLSLDHGLTYVEGLATVPEVMVPLHHAWCVTPSREVVDPTWDPLGVSYFGIPINPSYLSETALRTGIYSVFFNYRNRDLPNTPIADIISPLFDKP